MSAVGARCFGDGDPLYEAYHDDEWGRPIEDGPDERALLERFALEAFQSGLSWLTILRKRAGFRVAFCQFDPVAVAAFGPPEVEVLMQDAGIVRNRAKILATIADARALVAMHERGDSLRELVERFRPPARTAPPRSFAEVPAVTPESTALAKELKRLGFAFIGPTTAYAAMQAIGLVDDHLAACPVRVAARAN